MTGEEFRMLALAMYDTIERAHVGHPDFRSAGRIFASLDSAERAGTVKLTPEEQGELVREHPGVFAPAAGAWGRQGWTTVRLEAADTATVRGALLLAWQHVTSRSPSPRRQPARAAHRPPGRRVPRRNRSS